MKHYRHDRVSLYIWVFCGSNWQELRHIFSVFRDNLILLPGTMYRIDIRWKQIRIMIGKLVLSHCTSGAVGLPSHHLFPAFPHVFLLFVRPSFCHFSLPPPLFFFLLPLSSDWDVNKKINGVCRSGHKQQQHRHRSSRLFGPPNPPETRCNFTQTPSTLNGVPLQGSLKSPARCPGAVEALQPQKSV